MRIEGASALVAGGASGLGAATASALHEAGAAVVVADLNAERGEALAAELGERARFVEANVTDSDAVQTAITAAAEHDDGLRISVCCAGIGWAQRTASKDGPHDLQIFRNVVEVNLIGTFNVLRLAAAAMNETSPTRGGSGASASTPPRSPPSTARSGKPPTRRRRAASSASPCRRRVTWRAAGSVS
jgi:3-hydroxyacyl-CoA dehydrogenase / 3-hydroxy-2-methylbutyryl-CoA dehydrogenase